MRSLCLTIFIVILTGCALPKSPTELLAKDRKEVFCSQAPLEETNSKIYPRLARCYNKTSDVPVVTDNAALGGVLTRIRTQTKVYSEKNERGEPIYYVVMDGNFGLRLLLETSDETGCSTKLTAHTMNLFWERHVTRVKKWLDDPDAGCQIW